MSLSRAGSKPTQLILYNLKVITFSYYCQKYFPIMNKMFEMIVERESFKLFEFVTFIELHLFVDCCPYIHFRMLQKYRRQEEILADQMTQPVVKMHLLMLLTLTNCLFSRGTSPRI